jgi:hypothetical protein
MRLNGEGLRVVGPSGLLLVGAFSLLALVQAPSHELWNHPYLWNHLERRCDTSNRNLGKAIA